MAIFSNIDRNDAALNTKHPFDWSCALDLGSPFPVRELISVRLYVDDKSAVPLRIAKFVWTSTGMRWTIKDNTGDDCASVSFPEDAKEIITVPVRDTSGCLAGHVVCTPVFIRTVSAMLRAASGNIIDVNQDDFIFDTSCHIPILSGIFRALNFNGEVYTTDVTIFTGDNVKAEEVGASSRRLLRISAVSDYKENTRIDNKFTRLTLNGDHELVNNTSSGGVTSGGATGGWQLLLRHSLASNLRVVTTAANVHLMGVKDV